jgi:hypothetical protein
LAVLIDNVIPSQKPATVDLIVITRSIGRRAGPSSRCAPRVIHALNLVRADDIHGALRQTDTVVVGDVSTCSRARHR